MKHVFRLLTLLCVCVPVSLSAAGLSGFFLGGQPTNTTINPETDYFVYTLGGGTNAPYRLINANNSYLSAVASLSNSIYADFLARYGAGTNVFPSSQFTRGNGSNIFLKSGANVTNLNHAGQITVDGIHSTASAAFDSEVSVTGDFLLNTVSPGVAAIPYIEASGKVSPLTIGAGLSHVAGTLTASGGSASTNTPVIALGTLDATNKIMLGHADTPGLLFLTGTNFAGLTNTAIVLSNGLPALPGVQMASPPIIYKGSGHKTTATAGPQDVGMMNYLLPVQGTTTPTSKFIWAFETNNSGYAPMMEVNSAGNLTVAGGITAGTISGLSITAGAGWDVITTAGKFSALNASVMDLSTEGYVRFTGSGQINFRGIRFGQSNQTNGLISYVATTLGTSNGIFNLRSGNSNSWNSLGALSIELTNSPVAPASLNSMHGATLWSDGTNLCLVMKDSAGGITTNKVTTSPWP